MASFNLLGKYGRMGNALFQVAATLGHAERMDEVASFPSNWPHKSEFKLMDCVFINGPARHDEVYKEPNFGYDKIPSKKNCDLQGYFQSPKYWSHCYDLIAENISPKKDVEPMSGVCGVHVRRGDYVQIEDFHPTLDICYYYEAADLMPVDKFLVFSDDPEWCRQNFKDSRFTVFNSVSAFDDFCNMSACEHQIIANSSFSWWAAWINKNPDKKVVAPKNWFGPKLTPNHSTTDLIPEEWMQV